MQNLVINTCIDKRLLFFYIDPKEKHRKPELSSIVL